CRKTRLRAPRTRPMNAVSDACGTRPGRLDEAGDEPSGRVHLRDRSGSVHDRKPDRDACSAPRWAVDLDRAPEGITSVVQTEEARASPAIGPADTVVSHDKTQSPVG